MTTSGPAIFFDGATTTRRQVMVELAPTALVIRGADGAVLADWPYDHLDHLSAPAHVLRLGRAGSSMLARLEVREPELAAAIDHRSLPVDRSGRSERRMRAKVVAWSLAATVSLLVVAVFGVPHLATQLTPLVPVPVERKLGALIEAQVRGGLTAEPASSALECGGGAKERAGRAAFDKLMDKLTAAAALSYPLHPFVVRQSEDNAFALPGGHVYVFKGIIDEARTPDELAGVIAHEIGHVVHRDGTRTVLQGAGLSFLFGMLLGDFVGGGAVVVAAKTLLKNRYSRDVENAADLYGVALMSQVGGDPRALASLLQRIAGTHAGPKILLDHPETRDRVAAIEAAAGTAPRRPLLDQAEWAALKSICAGE
ncbi:MAG: M48 family metallopeptidase [Hyphomicrobiales bacterium]|nr:M48 family metallopeptidase [Hyphomicrobiales bacterium]